MIAHTAGHSNQILKASAKDLAASLSIDSTTIEQLLVEGGSLLESDGVVLVVVGASDRNGLSLNLGVELNELARVAFNGARMGCYLGSVLVVDDVHFERVGLVRADVVGGGAVRPFGGIAWCVECC